MSLLEHHAAWSGRASRRRAERDERVNDSRPSRTWAAGPARRLRTQSVSGPQAAQMMASCASMSYRSTIATVSYGWPVLRPVWSGFRGCLFSASLAGGSWVGAGTADPHGLDVAELADALDG